MSRDDAVKAGAVLLLLVILAGVVFRRRLH